MKISKALKLKNILAEEVNTLLREILVHNSYDVDSKKNYNAKDLYNEYKKKTEELIKLKTEIDHSSQPIRHLIYGLGELKSFLNTFTNLDTREGIIKAYMRTEPATFACDIDELEKQEIILQVKTQIQDIQDKIDEFNGTTDLVEL